MIYKKAPIWKIIIGTAALYMLPVLSHSVYAMGGCPEACNNQTTPIDCLRYGCHKDIDNKDTFHQCRWRKDVQEGEYHCVPRVKSSSMPSDSSDSAEAAS